MSEIERIEQGLETLFIKLLMAESDDARNSVLEPLEREQASEKALVFLAGKIQNGQSLFHHKAIELHYDNCSEVELDDFKVRLTLTADEIPDFFINDTNIPITWSLLEKAHKAVSIALMKEIKRQEKISHYKSLTGSSLFEGNLRADHSPEAQGPYVYLKHTDKDIARQDTQFSSTLVKEPSKSSPAHVSNANINVHVKYNSFADLFKSPDELSDCVKTLRAYRPDKPVINDRNIWMGKQRDGSKGILIAWVDRLTFCEKIPNLTANDLTPLLENFFPGLKFGKGLRYFGNVMKDDVRADFAKLIPE